ncbi:MAG: cobalamin-independent methionine synthase II family protein [Actinobacteria bacterium]|nr:cobalamin-independent methionine synthase II family protein [Actinomycetota bacterium]
MSSHAGRILTTHVGSLPRPLDVTTTIFKAERGEFVDKAEHEKIIERAVHDIVGRQVDSGVDIVSDGEMDKISYATYIKDRISGFDGDSSRTPPADLEDFPGFLEQLAKSGGTPTYKRPQCVSEIRHVDIRPVILECEIFRRAVTAHSPVGAFLNSASPGVIAMFQPNVFYTSHEAYLEAVAEAMRIEYEAIVAAGFILQIDSPDLGLGRHMMFKRLAEHEYLARINENVDALNHALRNVPADRVRMHVCWGNYEGPHTHDAPLTTVLPVALRAKPQGLLFESSNPRHAHEWEDLGKIHIPDDKVLIPGVVDTTTNFVEHPRLIAQRILNVARVVGRDRVIAGTDCGFSTFAGYPGIDTDIVFAKLRSMQEGAELASKVLW